jgi:HAD superfamily hydrolase (TIGR01549 family)
VTRTVTAGAAPPAASPPPPSKALDREGYPAPLTEVAERLAHAFSQQRDQDIRLEVGAEALLVELRNAGHRFALLTNGSGPLQLAKIKRFGPESYFDHIWIEGEVGIGKTCPAAFRRAFCPLAGEPRKVCVIGGNPERDIVRPRLWAVLLSYTIRRRAKGKGPFRRRRYRGPDLGGPGRTAGPGPQSQRG